MLQINNISKTFYAGTPNERIALDDLSLSVASGEFISIIGSNGAGKSSLFNAISGSFFVDSGQILLDGRDITLMHDYKRALDIGRLHQNPAAGTAPNMTIEENLSLAYTRKARRSFFAVNKADSGYFRDLLAPLGLGLEDRLHTKIGLLSGGQRQAVALLMSTISQPKLLLLDEHTAALDPLTAKSVLDITRSIVEASHVATLMITHDMNAALSLGTRTIMMDEGKIILDISGAEREGMNVDKLVELYSAQSKKKLATDRILLAKREE